MKKKFKVGIIGVGYWGPNILRVLLKNRNCIISKVVDISNKRRGYIQNIDNDIYFSNNVSDIIKDKEINSVFVCSPAKTHFKITLNCLKHHKNVFVEKPLALSLKDVNKLFSISKRNNLILMSGDQYIYHPAITSIKKIIKKKIIGKIYYINSQRLNLGRVRSDVDVKMNFSTHDLSIIQYLLDYKKPTIVKNLDTKVLSKKKSDMSFIYLKNKNNIYASINVSWIHPEKVRKILIVGSKKMLLYDDLNPGKIFLINKSIIPIHSKSKLDFDKNYFPKFEYIKKKSQTIKFKIKEPLKIEMNHFFKCLEERSNHHNLTGEEHCKNIFEIVDKFKN